MEDTVIKGCSRQKIQGPAPKYASVPHLYTRIIAVMHVVISYAVSYTMRSVPVPPTARILFTSR